MADMLIKKLPDELHLRLKGLAKMNRRSLNQETIVQLERALELAGGSGRHATPPPPLRLRKPVSWGETLKMIDEGQENLQLLVKEGVGPEKRVRRKR